MSDIDDGGYVNAYCDANGGEDTADFNGISRRDWLAGLAMQGICSNHLTSLAQYTELALHSYEIADAIIAEGRKE